MLKAIVFDFDGVVVDSEPVHFAAMREVAQTLGIDFDYTDYERELIGFDDRDAFKHITAPGSFGRPIKQTDDSPPVDIASLCQQKQIAFDQLVAQGVPAIPGTLALIDEVCGHFPTAIASGATRQDIEFILKGLNRLDQFDHIVSASDVESSKPHPETYLKACQLIGIEPANCLAIEDTVAGLTAAKSAGMMTLALTTTTAADQLHIAQRVIPNLKDVDLDTLRDWYSN